MENCLFCRIAQGAIPSQKVFENDRVLAFRDIHPQAPVHILIIPKKHLADLSELSQTDAQLMGELLLCAKSIAEKLGIDRSGYRIVSNCGPDACQSVQHLHIHLLGGKKLSEKMD